MLYSYTLRSLSILLCKYEFGWNFTPLNTACLLFQLDIFLSFVITIKIARCGFKCDSLFIVFSIKPVNLPICIYSLCLVTQSFLTFLDPVDCSLPGSSVHGDSPGNNTGVGCHALLHGTFPIARGFFNIWVTREAHNKHRIRICLTHSLMKKQLSLIKYDTRTSRKLTD